MGLQQTWLLVSQCQSVVHTASAEAERTVKTGSINLGATMPPDTGHSSHKAIVGRPLPEWQTSHTPYMT